MGMCAPCFSNKVRFIAGEILKREDFPDKFGEHLSTGVCAHDNIDSAKFVPSDKPSADVDGILHVISVGSTVRYRIRVGTDTGVVVKTYMV